MKLIGSMLIVAMLITMLSGDIVTGQDVLGALDNLTDEGVKIEDFTLTWKDGQGTLGTVGDTPAETTPPPAEAPTPTKEQWESYLDLKKELGGGGMVAALSMDLGEFLALADADYATVKEKITTVTDCLYLLRISDFRGTSSYGGKSTTVQAQNDAGVTMRQSFITFSTAEQVWAAKTGSRPEVAQLIAGLLEGDYDEVGYVYSYRANEMGKQAYRWVTNYVRDGEMTHTFNGGQFAEEKSLNYRLGKGFDEVIYAEYTRAFSNLTPTKFIATCPETGEGFVPHNYNGTPCFIIPASYLDRVHVVMETPDEKAALGKRDVDETELEKIFAAAASITDNRKQDADSAIRRITSEAPVKPRGLTITWAEAEALVGAELDTVKATVKTLEDCIYFYAATNRGQLGGDIEYRPIGSPDDVSWHFNFSPQMVFAHGFGDCGGNAALVYYLLDGDYDEVGYIGMARNGGGHITNYLRDGDIYYTFDMNQFAGNNRSGINFHASKSLNDATIAGFGKNYSAIHTYTGCNDGDAPIGWSSKTGSAGGTQHLIKDYAPKINIVKEDPATGCVYKLVEVGEDVLDIIHLMRNQD